MTSPRNSRENLIYRLLERTSILLLIFLILYTPLPFGSVQYQSVFLIETVAAVCFFLWLIRQFFFYRNRSLRSTVPDTAGTTEIDNSHPFLRRHGWLNDPSGRSYFSLMTFRFRNTGLERIGILSFVIVLFQLIPLPQAVLRLFSPQTVELYSGAFQMAGFSRKFYPISLDAYATIYRLLECASYFMIYIVAVNVIRSRAYYKAIIYALFVSALFQAMYGLYEFLSGNQQIFNFHKIHNLDCATGTFINRNHYAAYLELSLPLCLALVTGRISRLKEASGSVMVKIARALEAEGSQVLLFLFAIVILAVAILFSLSRSGISFAILTSILFFFSTGVRVINLPANLIGY